MAGILEEIYSGIDREGFSDEVLGKIASYSNDIRNGHTNFARYNIPEHAGLCVGDKVLIGASIIAGYASRSIGAGGDAREGKTGPASWEIDERQEQLIEQWAKASRLWVDDSENKLTSLFGKMIAKGAESKVYYKPGDISVVKERTSIYSTTQKALDSIVLHNYLFPETAMKVIGFSRDSDGLLRTILTQPYIRCKRLATKEEIDALLFGKGFWDNGDGNGTNYTSDDIALEDMHPANVFIDEITDLPICIDCIVKFKQSR